MVLSSLTITWPSGRTKTSTRARPVQSSAANAATAALSSDELIDLLDRNGIANARLRDLDEFVAHPQMAARDRWRTVGTPGGDMEAMLPPVTMAGVEWAMGDVPALGADTASVLAEFGLGQD